MIEYIGLIIFLLIVYLAGLPITIEFVKDQVKYDHLIFIPLLTVIFWPVVAAFYLVRGIIKQIKLPNTIKKIMFLDKEKISF